MNIGMFAKLVSLVSLRRFLNPNGVQHVGVNVDDMKLSREFYCDILGGILYLKSMEYLVKNGLRFSMGQKKMHLS